MAIDYLWHDHPLQLRSIPSNTKAQCYVCLQPISGYNYICPKTGCNFFLHISCLKFPLESLHPLHHLHPLSLLREPPHPDNSTTQTICNQCNNPCSAFTYNCAPCSFSLHLQCAIKQWNFSYEVHKHPLSFSASPPSGFESFLCNICGEFGYGFSLICKICLFVIHIECSVLPFTVNYKRHDHPFTMITVQSIEDGTGEFYCDVCEELVNIKGCIYYCADCIYIGHLGCMASAQKPHIKFSYKDVDILSLENSDETKIEIYQTDTSELQPYQVEEDEGIIKLRGSFSKHHIEQIDSVLELEHFSHQHPLVLSGDYGKEDISCYACWGEIKGMAYSCVECKFFLHKWCAELPKNIKHPIHYSHRLTLLAGQPYHLSSECRACYEPCDGFTYNCSRCGFNIHAMCASIPSTLINEIHSHPLILCRRRPYSIKCQACCNDCTGTVFECKMCNLELDFKCALLPYKVKHKCHIDRLVLKSRVLEEDDSEEFYCDACETLRDPKHWVYSCCEDCEYNAHMECVVSEFIGGCPMPGLIDFNHHEHLLRLITKAPSSSSAS